MADADNVLTVTTDVLAIVFGVAGERLAPTVASTLRPPVTSRSLFFAASRFTNPMDFLEHIRASQGSLSCCPMRCIWVPHRVVHGCSPVPSSTGCRIGGRIVHMWKMQYAVILGPHRASLWCPYPRMGHPPPPFSVRVGDVAAIVCW